MTTEKFDWKSSLAELFSATVNQQTIEEAVELMLSVSAEDSSYHNECLLMLDEGLQAAREGDSSVISCINKSGYQVLTTTDAAALLLDFRETYLTEYKRTTTL